MQNLQIRLPLIIILITFLISLLKGQECKFFYKDFAGNYSISFLINEKFEKPINDTLQIDFNNFENPNVEVEFRLKGFDFGYDKNCKPSKNKKHNQIYFIEKSINKVPNKIFRDLEWETQRLGAILNKNEKSKTEISTTLNSENFNEDKEGKLEIIFNILDGKGIVGTGTIPINYKIIAPKLIGNGNDNRGGVAHDEINTDTIKVSKDTIESKRDTIKFLTAEQQIWEDIQTAVGQSDGEKIRRLCYNYRANFKENGKYLEEAWFYSIKYSIISNNRETLCKRYPEKYRNGVFKEQIKALCETRRNRTESLSESDFWKKKVLRRNSKKAYHSYLSKYGEDGVYSYDSRVKLEEFSISETGRKVIDSIGVNFEYSFKGNENKSPKIRILEGTEMNLDTIINSSSKIQFLVKEGGIVVAEFAVPKSPWKKDTIEIDASILPLIAKWNDNENAISLVEINNGKPPYSIELINVDEGSVVNLLAKKSQLKNWSINIDSIKVELSGNYKLRIRDKTKTRSFTSSDFFIEVDKPKPFWTYSLGASILLLLVGLIIYQIFGKKVKLKSTLNKKSENSREQKIADEKYVPIPHSKIVVKGKRERDNIPDHELNASLFVLNDGYLELKMSDLWEDSIVRAIYLSKKCGEELQQFVFNSASIHRLPNGEMPEIGGFIIGKAMKEESGEYFLTFEEFLDIEPETQGVYQISFGAKAWSKLEKENERYKRENKELIGWFHTHPGHGLFLSRPDLNIHKNFFNYPYQIAMEIDNVKGKNNPTWDVGFFTQRKNGEINNSKGLKSKWFQWTNIESWLQKDLP